MINELKETHNQNVDQQNGFHHLLDEMGILYKEDDSYLNVGDIPEVSGWVLFLTANIDLVPDLIRTVCPLLSKEGVPYSVVKGRKIAAMKNDFWYGAHEVGKMIIIFTTEEITTKKIISRLEGPTVNFWGPSVNYTVRLKEIIYLAFVSYTERQEDDGSTGRVVTWLMPNWKKIPFKVERRYQYWKRKKLLKRRYVPLQMLSRSPKGDLLKSVDLKGFRFNWCFIKEGKYKVFDDNHGRFIKDRLQWQAKVLQELDGHVPVPKFIDYFEQGEDSYLVMEFLEGIDLFRKMEAIYEKRKWADLPCESQVQLVGYYLDVLGIIEKMHRVGYVHRDATAANFMIVASGKMYAIDLELSYCLKRNEPEHPFALGVFGYVAPEQIRLQTPTVKEDIYTMGSLLLHILSGNHPNRYINQQSEVNEKLIREEVMLLSLLDIMLRCFDVDPDKRPDLEELRNTVESVFKSMIL